MKKVLLGNSWFGAERKNSELTSSKFKNDFPRLILHRWELLTSDITIFDLRKKEIA